MAETVKTRHRKSRRPVKYTEPEDEDALSPRPTPKKRARKTTENQNDNEYHHTRNDAAASEPPSFRQHQIEHHQIRLLSNTRHLVLIDNKFNEIQRWLTELEFHWNTVVDLLAPYVKAMHTLCEETKKKQEPVSEEQFTQLVKRYDSLPLDMLSKEEADRDIAKIWGEIYQEEQTVSTQLSDDCVTLKKLYDTLDAIVKKRTKRTMKDSTSEDQLVEQVVAMFGEETWTSDIYPQLGDIKTRYLQIKYLVVLQCDEFIRTSFVAPGPGVVVIPHMILNFVTQSTFFNM
eukprot:GILJ01014904.1.p1 GENE.GILJ01014904.1~~GILJ01014904.1.p1  ORF type:complete len:288 (+),score=33.59 GILJ01014904.1:870-1733(+)